MAKSPAFAFAKAFAGPWRIVEMDVWDIEFLDLVMKGLQRTDFGVTPQPPRYTIFQPTIEAM